MLEPQGDGARLLKVVVDELRAERKLITIPSEHRCGVELETRGDLAIASVGCGLREVVRVTRQGRELEIAMTPPRESGALYTIREDTEVLFASSVEDRGNRNDCKPEDTPTPLLIKAELGPGRKVEIGPGYRWAPRTLRLRIPAMKIDREVTTIEQEFCRGHFDLLRERYEASCSSEDGTRSLDVRTEGDALLFAEGYVGGGREALGGLTLPCGASPRFEPLWYLAPGYQPPGAACELRCTKPQLPCFDQCDLLQRKSGDVTAAGACRDRCREPVERCAKGCPPR